MKRKYLVLCTVVPVFIALASCNSREEQEKQADARLKHIEQLIVENSLNAAKIEIDSIHILFPKLVDRRRVAEDLEDTVVRRESARSLAYCNEMLPVKQHEADSIRKNFRFEKNEAYQQFGNFVFKTQRTENNATRTYLKSYVDENADFYLISNYCGAKIEHVAVQVSVDGVFARTDTVATGNAFNHGFSDGGMHWETITFKNEKGKEIGAFVEQNAVSRIKVDLEGKRHYAYFLEPNDKKAISETYHLWVVMKDISRLKNEIRKATIRIERINRRMKK
ncbi:MAG TPA: hypothetical protein VK152_05735 [Paludibacter sp.]|nr:hypothetical protein [Paludibacter sp.]